MKFPSSGPYIERHIEATTAAFGLNRNATERPFTPSGQQTCRSRAGRHAARQYSSVGLARLQRHDHADSGAAPVLHVSRHRRGSLFHQRPHQAGAAVSARNRREPIVRRGQPELDQSALHLYARLWRGGIRGQQDHARRPARPADRKRAAGNQVARVSSSRGRKFITARSTQDPVFVHTAREEFDYPSGDQNKYSTYQGTGGFPVGSFPAEDSPPRFPRASRTLFSPAI